MLHKARKLITGLGYHVTVRFIPNHNTMPPQTPGPTKRTMVTSTLP